MSEWLEHSVQVEVAAPIEHVWDLWQNIELMPRWMKWIESVKVLEDKPELSRWKFFARIYLAVENSATDSQSNYPVGIS
jgi:uncharacterized membrane protein